MRPNAILLSVLLFPALTVGATTGDFGISVAMQEKSAATFYVDGEIQGYGPVHLMVDTGSGYMTINERTLAALKRSGTARYVKDLIGVLADGSELRLPVYSISRLRIGERCWIEDVEAAVFPGEARQILGLSALRRAAPFIFSVDPPSLTLSRCDAADTVERQRDRGRIELADQPG